ncbi:L,D-transpeptidase [Nocardia xishanensis]|uniref:L,D-transpeptidase n=1 Tax=Nocardia xishanensis TaxID=238964 RepID=UPI000A0176BD|nr:L,D-transpeptidase [Nocardia xishanensis]
MKCERLRRPVARLALLIGTAAIGFAVAAPAQGEPLWPGGPDIPGVPPLIAPPPPAPVVAPCTAPKARGCMRLSTNEAWLMDNGKVTYGPTPISHGREGFRTRAGVFDVDFKREDHWSTMHHVWMKYAVFFDGDIATHIGPIEEESHGCIRMTPDGAREFFYYLEPGDIIEVVP